MADAAKEQMAAAEKELSVAQPLIVEAMEAVDCLSKPMIDELKSFNTLAKGVDLAV